jgi:hypothetical protein
MGLTEIPLYRKYGTEDETSAHVLCKCEALATHIYHHLGSFFLDHGDFRNLNLGAI